MIKDKNGNEIIVGMYINEHAGRPTYFVTETGADWIKVETFLTAAEVAESYEFVPAE